METFLTKSDKTKIQLLYTLLERKKWWKLDELAKQFQVSKKSIKLYLQEFEKVFKNFKGEITLFYDNNQSILLKKTENFPIYNVYLHYYKKSYNFRLINHMFIYPQHRLEDFARCQFTSISTVYRYGKLLIPFFQRFKIKFQPYALKLIAPESAIRSFYYYFYWQSYVNNCWPFEIEKSSISKQLDCFEEIYKITFNPTQRKIFEFWLAIIRWRHISGFPAEVDKEWEEVITMDQYFSLLEKWNQSCKQLSLSDYRELPYEELLYLYQIIYSYGIIDGNPKYENEHAMIHKMNNSVSFQSVCYFAAGVKLLFDYELDLNDPELIFNFVAFHERARQFYGNTDIFFNRLFSKDIHRSNNEIYQTILELRSYLEEKASKETKQIFENWEQLVLNYYFILDYYDLLVPETKEIKILLLSDVHHSYRLWLKHKIIQFFGKVYNMYFFDYEKDIEQVDLVISNYYINCGGKPFLLMRTIPTERNWRTLEKMLFKCVNEV